MGDKTDYAIEMKPESADKFVPGRVSIRRPGELYFTDVPHYEISLPKLCCWIAAAGVALYFIWR
jgi:hypothetical protein